MYEVADVEETVDHGEECYCDCHVLFISHVTICCHVTIGGHVIAASGLLRVEQCLGSVHQACRNENEEDTS